MARDRDPQACNAALRPLTKQEIDRRLQRLADELSGPLALGGNASEPDDESLRPQWITPAELVRRLSRFIVYN